jgi:bacterioferritin-associated ferredoxin
MEESKLQREFNQRDVQRMRNIITKDYNAKTTTQIGYTKSQAERKEGDVWEEGGKQWTLKNGIKQTVTRFDELKKVISLPLACPKCSKAMQSTTLNKKMWPIHKMCFDCVVKMETDLKRTGQYEEYARNIVNRGATTYIKDLEDALLELALYEDNESFVTEAGDIEKWTGKGIDKEKLTQDIQEHIQEIKDQIKD